MVPVRSCRGHCDWDRRARGRSVERRLEGNKLFQPEGTCPTGGLRCRTLHKSGRAPRASADSRPAPGRPPPAFGFHLPRSANPGPSHHTTEQASLSTPNPHRSHPTLTPQPLAPATSRKAEGREEPNDKTHPVKVLPFNPVPETSEDSSKLLGSPNQKLEPTEQGPARPGRWSSHFPSRQDPAAIWPGSTRPIRQKAGRHRDRQGHWGCRRRLRQCSPSAQA